MRHYIVRKLSTHRSRLRVYLDIRSLAEAGFHPGQQYSRHLDATRKVLRLSIEPDGAYVVSRKQKAGEELPVIDINKRVGRDSCKTQQKQA